MSKKKIILYLLVITITLLSVNIQLSFMLLEDQREVKEEGPNILEYYPFLGENKPKEYKGNMDNTEKNREKDTQEGISPTHNTGEQSPPEEIQPEKPSISPNHDDKQSQQNYKKATYSKTDLCLKEELAKREREAKEFSPPKEEETVFTYNEIKKKTKELSIKDKIALYGLMKNMNKVSIIHINGMVKGGLTEGEIERIEHILKRELDQREFEQAKRILDKYIHIE